MKVLGAGGHGQDVRDVALACGYHFDGFLDDNAGPAPWTSLDGPYAFGVHDPVVRCLRDDMSNPALVLVHPAAYCEPDVEFDDGVVVGPRAIIGPNVKLGRHVHVGQGSSMVRTRVGAYTSISPGVTIAGDVWIGQAVTIGAGATISNLCRIEDGAVIGAGAVLRPRTMVPTSTTWVGVPARQVTT